MNEKKINEYDVALQVLRDASYARRAPPPPKGSTRALVSRVRRALATLTKNAKYVERER